MKTMLFSDFLSIRRSLPQSVLIGLVVAIVCSFFGGIPFAGAIVCSMVPVTIVFSVQLYDDQNDWSGYRLTLPVNRRQVVWGRYLFMALCAMGAFLVGCAIVVVCGFLSQSGLFSQALLTLSGMSALSGAPAGEFIPFFEILPIGLAGTYLALLFVLLLLAVTLPLLMRYGLTQAVRFVPIACCIVFLLAMVWLTDSGSGVLSWLDVALMDSTTVIWLGIGVTALCCALYIASAALTARLYAAREF